MTSKNLADYGIYPRRSVVKQVVPASNDTFSREAVMPVLLPESDGFKDFPTRKANNTSEGIATGAGAGTVVGGALGWLMGIGFLAIPGIGPFVATIDPIMVALVGASSGGLFGGITGALIAMGIFQYEANLYAEESEDGEVVMPVQTDEKEWKDISHKFIRFNRG